ncbi:MAG: PLP-dependent aminotransferase family protein [Ruminococcaceae bacterium]|nr:PLP-dependent aminotransferase family protein [Oscillospiraceae bacterium]
MKYKIDKSTRPVYLQIYKQIKEDIINGNYPFNTKLPSKRLLADETETSTVTVEHAYELLCDEGYVESRERSGFFVVFRNTDGFAMPSDDVAYIPEISHGHGAGLSFPFSVLAKTMRAVIGELGAAILEKSDNKGCIQLRLAIKKYLAKNRGISVDVEQIIIGSGAEYLYGLIIELLGRDRIYGIESPSYKKIKQVYSAAEVSYEELRLSGDGVDSAALSSTDANVLHTTPYRSYPTGVSASASKRHEYIRWAGARDRYIIEDDFESEFSVSSKPEDTLFAISDRDNVIYLNTFSMTISSSLRVGYMVLPRRLLGRFAERLGFYSCTVPTFEQHVIARLIQNGDFERHINRVRRHKRSAKK